MSPTEALVVRPLMVFSRVMSSFIWLLNGTATRKFAKRCGARATLGDRVSFTGGELEVVAIDGRRVAAVRVHRTRREEG